MLEISRIVGREIIDSRGNPTIEADVILKSGMKGSAAVPSGASTGSREAVELRDGDRQRFAGKGVMQAVSHINNEIASALKGQDGSNQQSVDQLLIELDGTDNKAKLGANAILAVSLATARAVANANSTPLYNALGYPDVNLLPVPMMNVINGGAHAANSIDMQEFMIMPVGATSIKEAIQMGAEVFHVLKDVLGKKGHSTAVGDEGGFAPDLSSNVSAIETILEAVEKAGYNAGKDIFIALDPASSEFYQNGFYHLESENLKMTSDEFVAYLKNWADQYPIISIEDGMAEDDWLGWDKLTKAIGQKTQLVGDDLFVTNTDILSKGIKEGIANSILIKVNQIGTLSESIAAIEMAKNAGYSVVVSHRSGETEDTFIADLAVASSAGQIKTGSMSRSDRVAKYNQLIRIEEALGSQARFAGFGAFPAGLGLSKT